MTRAENRAMPALLASLLLAGPGLAAAATDSGCDPVKDALSVTDPLLAPVRPAHCATVTQTPPDFTWPEIPPPPSAPAIEKDAKKAIAAPAPAKPPPRPKGEYTLTLHHPDGRVQSWTTPNHWIALDQVLPPGTYRWTVRLPDGTRSQPRRFTIAPGAVESLLPTADAVVAHARRRPHPRTWARDESSPIAALKAERARAFAKLVAEVESKITTPVQPEPVATSINANYGDIVAEHKRTLNSALAWAVTKKERYGADAARRLLAQARWSPTGPISFANNDMGSRTVAWTLALGYDWAYDYLSPADRNTILAAIAHRTRDMFEHHSRSGAITRYPYDSHGNLTLTITAAIAALIAGDWPEADGWLRETAIAAAVWTSPWGGSDGGFANGTMQGLWDTGSNLLAWYALEGATGIDFSRREWVRNHSRFLAYFNPPGAPFGVFGDGQEMDGTEFRARVAKALALFSPTPIGRWHASRLKGEMDERVELLLAPRRRPGKRDREQAQFPDAALFPSIGWAALHSDLEDPKRTSVYFRSSAYGAFNHGHADQNSFVIDHLGERLAIKSGYYDDYKTPHWLEWYKPTRSANAITFDGGRGQGPDGKQFAGEIVRFESDGKLDRVVGRAEAAYGGALTRALREIVYLRPGVVVVYDDLASGTPRTWEWNLHALERMEAKPDGRVAVRKGKAAMCVEMLASPGVAFTQTDRFTVPPAGKRAAQWHGTFATTEKTREAQFVTLMRIGSDCAPGDAPASARRLGGRWEVKVGAAALRLGGDGAPPSRAAARRDASDVAQQ